MSDVAISVQNLSKRYLIGRQSVQRERYTSLRDVITREVKNFGRKATELIRGEQIIQGDDVEEFWALRSVSFEVEKGEVLGIIGRNGAGKSTLLKILSRITEPTEGYIKIRGRAASLLEVGTGFHPELTGRENIFLNGAVLGMRRADIKRKFDEIVAFAEVEKFLDTPVKRYSSGMYLRLAFAVAAHLEPEILFVDEILAVGDAEFQKKCLGKIDEVSKREGRTVLFVSHNMGAMASLCPTVIWLEGGQVRRQGAAREVVNEYLVQRLPNQDRRLALDSHLRPDVEDQRLRLQSLEWLCELPLRHAQPVKARIHFKTNSPIGDVTVGIGFSAVDGGRLLTYETDFPDGIRPSVSRPGLHSVEVTIDSLPLAPDIYNFDVGCRSGDFHGLDYLPAVVQLEIVPGPTTPGTIVRKGAGVRLESSWTWLDNW
jgi:lipopolysaccharide transport system ATP-binding protein